MRHSIHRRIARRQANIPPLDSDPTSPTGPSATSPSTTAPSTAPPQAPTSTTPTPSSTSDGGLISSLFGPSPSSSPSSSSSSSTISTPISASLHSTGSHTFPGHAQPITSLAAKSDPLSTSSVSITSSSATASQANPNASTNNDSGPIAGGVIGGIFAVAALGMLISFLLRRWRRRQIDRAVFGTTDFRKSAMALDDDASSDTLTQPQHNNPRPPTMIERRVAGTPAPVQQRMHAGVAPPQAYGGYGQPPFYPPQSMQRGYYPQQPDRSYTLQPAAYNQMYNGGGPPRTQTPLHQPQLLQNSNSLLNPYEAPSVSPMPATAGDGENAGTTE